MKKMNRKMVNKKKNGRTLPISRQQSLCKIISFVYTYAFHLYFNHQQDLFSLAIPLFHYFKIGYGQLKKNDLYLRMLYFLSQIIAHQEERYIFRSFIDFLGIDIGNNKNTATVETTCFYLKLLHQLSANFSFPIDIETLYSTT